jgi:hypothetical protein
VPEDVSDDVSGDVPEDAREESSGAESLSHHPDLASTGAAMREAWRAEQEAAARDARESWTHRQTVTDRLRAHMHRGDTLTVTVAGHRLTGTVDEVGNDLLALRTASGRVDVHLAPTIWLQIDVAAAARTGGHRGSNAAGGRFRHALVGRERDPRVRVGTLAEPGGVDGTVEVGADHVVVTTASGRTVIVPMAAVAWVSPAVELDW